MPKMRGDKSKPEILRARRNAEFAGRETDEGVKDRVRSMDWILGKRE
jgi:hypothetical protein